MIGKSGHEGRRAQRDAGCQGSVGERSRRVVGQRCADTRHESSSGDDERCNADSRSDARAPSAYSAILIQIDAHVLFEPRDHVA